MSEQAQEAKPTKKQSKPLLSRRDFLKVAGATGAAVAFTQVVVSGPLSADAIEGHWWAASSP
jgi:hypothetical protein